MTKIIVMQSEITNIKLFFLMTLVKHFNNDFIFSEKKIVV